MWLGNDVNPIYLQQPNKVCAFFTKSTNLIQWVMLNVFKKEVELFNIVNSS